MLLATFCIPTSPGGGWLTVNLVRVGLGSIPTRKVGCGTMVETQQTGDHGCDRQMSGIGRDYSVI